MKTNGPVTCDDVRMSALARLDGETPELPAADADRHVADCDACRASIAALTALHADLDRVAYDGLDVDLWPGIRSHLPGAAPSLPRRERGAILGLAAAIGAWRIAQLSIDLPGPVVNSIVPLALIVLVLWRLAGDPFTIRVAPFQLERGA